MKRVIARAPINIALIKYWGKADEIRVLPTTHSLSLTLTDLYSETILESGAFSFELNGQAASEEETNRVKDVLKHFSHQDVRIQSKNNFPTASGLASSASGFAALTVGFNHFFDANYTRSELVNLTRLGSGSSCRSLVDGFAIWEKNGSVRQLTNPFTNLRMIVVIISQEKKMISSRKAMKHTQETAPLYSNWCQTSEMDFQEMVSAIQQNDFAKVGLIMERNSESLHHIMGNAQPPIIYQQEASKRILALVKEARNLELIGYATMDAGPNVKILIEGKQLSQWQSYLAKHDSHPFIVSRIGGRAHAE